MRRVECKILVVISCTYTSESSYFLLFHTIAGVLSKLIEILNRRQHEALYRGYAEQIYNNLLEASVQ